MKINFVLSALVVFCLSTNIWARTFSIERSAKTTLNPDQAQTIITDYASYCKSGCRYYLSGVAQMRVVSTRSADEFFTWMHVDDKRTYKYFSKVLITHPQSNVTIITSTDPSSAEIKSLKAATGLPHGTFFDASRTVWTIRENSDGTATIDYQGDFTLNSGLSGIYAPFVNRSLKETADNLFAAFNQ